MHVARVVVHAVVSLTLGYGSCRCFSFCRRVSVAIFLFLEVYSLHHPVGDSKLRWLLPNITVISDNFASN